MTKTLSDCFMLPIDEVKRRRGLTSALERTLRNCRSAESPAHGLRKAIAARLAEQGASAHEIMAVTGHKTLEEVERYTREAERKKLADSAMSKFKK